MAGYNYSRRARQRQRLIAKQTAERRRQVLVDTLAGDDPELRAELEDKSLAQLIGWKNTRAKLPGMDDLPDS